MSLVLPSRSRFTSGSWLAFALLAISALGSVGCNQSATSGSTASTSNPAAAPSKPPATAREVIERMAAAYQNCKTYTDDARIDFKLEFADQKVDEHPDFAVSLVRPNKLRLSLFQTQVACDGKRLRAVIGDERFQGEVLDVEAPATLTLDDFYSERADEILKLFLTQGGIAGGSFQLMLLLNDKPLDAVVSETKDMELLEPAPTDKHACYRVRVVRDDGALVFWIDQETFVVRRLEFPTEGLKKRFEEQNGPVTMVSLAADFRDARFDAPIEDAAFTLPMPNGAKLVSRFDPRKLSPPPPPPSKLLGQPIPDFSLTGLDGEPITRDSLAGQVVVIDFWATWCGPCRASLPNLQQVYQKYRDHEKVKFLAVSIDEPDVKAEDLRKAFETLGVEVPVARVGGDLLEQFGLSGIPNLIILGPDGVLQDNEVGYNPNLPQELPERLEKLLAGHDLHQEALERYQKRLEEHDRELSQPEQAEAAASNEPPKAEIAPKSEPGTLKLTQAWTCGDLTQPGNIMVLDQAEGEPRLLVVEAWRGVAELDVHGQVVGKHPLDIPEEAFVGALRTGVDADGKRYFAGVTTNQPQMHLFDDQWKRLFSYPDESKAGVADVLLADLDGDKALELYVSYWDVVGVQRVSLDGQRLWGNREMENVFRLAVTGPDDAGVRRLIGTDGGQQGLVLLDHEGKKTEQVVVGTRFLRYVASADLDGDGKLEYCGLAATTEGRDEVVGFLLDGTELWSHPLAKGIHQQPVEMITTGRLLPGDARQWLVAGPDASILVIGADGQLADSFHYGAELTGLAAAENGDKRLLLVATPAGVDCWQVGE